MPKMDQEKRRTEYRVVFRSFYLNPTMTYQYIASRKLKQTQ